MKIANSKILVTGGAGFVGSNLIKKILKDHPGCNITVLDNMYTGKKENVHPDVVFINGSTFEIERYFPQVVGTFDIVFHFGEYSRVVPSFNDINYVMLSNLHGTSKVIDMCRNWGAKLIYSASSSGFGNNGEDQNLSPYSWAKSKMVELIKNYGEWFGLRYEICYFFNVYGPGQIESGDYATVVGIFEKQYREGKKLTVVSPGTQTRDFTHIDDIVNGVLASVDKDLNGRWLLRSGIETSVWDLVKMFGMLDNNELIPSRRGERQRAESFPNDTRSKLNWEPKHNLKDYIDKIINK